MQGQHRLLLLAHTLLITSNSSGCNSGINIFKASCPLNYLIIWPCSPYNNLNCTGIWSPPSWRSISQLHPSSSSLHVPPACAHVSWPSVLVLPAFIDALSAAAPAADTHVASNVVNVHHPCVQDPHANAPARRTCVDVPTTYFNVPPACVHIPDASSYSCQCPFHFYPCPSCLYPCCCYVCPCPSFFCVSLFPSCPCSACLFACTSCLCACPSCLHSCHAGVNALLAPAG